MRHTMLLATLALVACDTPITDLACEEIACAHIAACTPSQTEGIDFRSEKSCLAAGWTCVHTDACLEAVYALPCLSSPPTEDEAIAATRAFVDVKRECLGIVH